MPNPLPISIELIPDPDVGGFTACLPDIPAYGEGETQEAAIADLKEALRTYIEAAGLDEALSRLRPPAEHRALDWNLADLAHG